MRIVVNIDSAFHLVRLRSMSESKNKNSGMTIEDLAGTVSNLAETVKDLVKAVASLTVTVNDLAVTVNNLAASVQREFISVNKRFDSIEADVVYIKQDVSDIKQTNRVLVGDMAEIKVNLEEQQHERRINVLELETRHQDGRVRKIEQTVGLVK